MSKKNWLGLIKTVLPIGLGLYLFWVFFSGMTPEHKASFNKAVREVNYFWIFLSLVLSFVALAARAIRWKYMLEPLGYSTPVKNRYHAMMIGYLINFTIPRAGEASRAAMLYRSDGVPFSKSFGTIIAERAVDLIMLGSVALLTMAVGYEDLATIFGQIKDLNADSSSDGSSKTVFYLVLGVLLLALVTILILKPTVREKLVNFIKDVFQGVLAIFKTKNPLGFIGHTLLIWVCYIAMFALPFYSLKETIDFPLSGILIGFIVGALGISLTNGGLGVYPLLVGMVVTFYLKDDYPETADGVGKALGMIVWLSQTVFMIAMGLISLALLPKNFSKEKPAQDGEPN